MTRPDLLAATTCPGCASTDVDRMWVASWHVDACRCRACGRRWDEAGADRG